MYGGHRVDWDDGTCRTTLPCDRASFGSVSGSAEAVGSWEEVNISEQQEGG